MYVGQPLATDISASNQPVRDRPVGSSIVIDSLCRIVDCMVGVVWSLFSSAEDTFRNDAIKVYRIGLMYGT